jgi:hypothetical protein
MRLLLVVGCAAVAALAGFVAGVLVGEDAGWSAGIEWSETRR